MLVYTQIVLQRNIVMGIAIIGIFLFFIPACITNARPYWQDIQDDKPKTVSGQIFKLFTTTYAGRPGGRMPIGHCSIRIEDQTFSILPFVYDQLIDEKNYRIYFLQHSRKILNIKPI